VGAVTSLFTPGASRTAPASFGRKLLALGLRMRKLLRGLRLGSPERIHLLGRRRSRGLQRGVLPQQLARVRGGQLGLLLHPMQYAFSSRLCCTILLQHMRC